jgi:hypothetical protein
MLRKPNRSNPHRMRNFASAFAGRSHGIGAASAAPSAAAASPPVESVVVTGVSSEAVNHFVEAAATPTHIIGKVARWESPVCLPHGTGNFGPLAFCAILQEH